MSKPQAAGFSLLLSFLLLSPMTVAVSLGELEEEEQPQPKMRVVDRDWSYFQSFPCEKVHTLVHHSRSEEILIAKRKSQCMNRYKAFLPKPVEH